MAGIAVVQVTVNTEAAQDNTKVILSLEEVAGLAGVGLGDDVGTGSASSVLDEDTVLSSIATDYAKQTTVSGRTEAKEATVVVQTAVTEAVTAKGAELADVVLRTATGQTTTGADTVR